MSTVSNSFNYNADKVVAFKEMRQKINALYKEELSTGEKAYLYLVDKPLSIVAGFGDTIKDI